MGNVKLPPQTSPTDTSNWDNKVFTAPVVGSVKKINKNKERREMILNAPKSNSPKTPRNPDIQHKKK